MALVDLVMPKMGESIMEATILKLAGVLRAYRGRLNIFSTGRHVDG